MLYPVARVPLALLAALSLALFMGCAQDGATSSGGAGAGYSQVLSACGAPAGGQLSGWRWSFPGAEAEYRGLYPRAWTDYQLPGQQLRLTCRQISPVIPHNYKVRTIGPAGGVLRSHRLSGLFGEGGGTPLKWCVCWPSCDQPRGSDV